MAVVITFNSYKAEALEANGRRYVTYTFRTDYGDEVVIGPYLKRQMLI